MAEDGIPQSEGFEALARLLCTDAVYWKNITRISVTTIPPTSIAAPPMNPRITANETLMRMTGQRRGPKVKKETS